jgi:glycosyltransferase involved in cell wall biosynthesis
MAPLQSAFVMEQALGHVTHFQNLRQFTAEQPDIQATWLPIPFELTGRDRLVPVMRNWSVRASWRARRALHDLRRTTALDAIFFHTQVTSLFSIAHMRQIPSIVSLDATPINYDSLGHSYGHAAATDSFLDRQKYRLNRQALHAAAGLVTWSEWARDSLIGDYGVDGSRIRVVGPGAAPDYFEIGAARLAGAPREPGPVRLLFVGADFQRKGGPELLAAMRGPLGDLCELHVVTRQEVAPQRNVFVHQGVTPNSPTLTHLFANADVFVLPTHADCMAIVNIEAAAAALPIVTTTVGALGENVRPGESGFLIPPGNVEALAEALSTLVANADLRAHMSHRSFEVARHKFDAHRNQRVILDFLHEVAETRSPQRRAA